MMIARIREVINERTCTLHSVTLLKQLANFGENESGRCEALSGHDDLLFAFGIALCSRRENYFPTAAQAPDTTNRFDPSAFGFPMRPYVVTEALSKHFAALQKRAGTGEDKDWMSL